MLNMKMGAFLLAAFVAGSFVASPELRAYAANTVGSIDIIDESILSADIKTGEVKASDIATGAVGASEIATNSVGASELVGVTKLLFGQCSAGDLVGDSANHNGLIGTNCSINGSDTDDSVIATLNGNGNTCWDVALAFVNPDNNVRVFLRNNCEFNIAFGAVSSIPVIVYDK